MNYNGLRNISTALSLVCGLAAMLSPLNNEALTVTWGDAYESGSGVVLPYTISNDDAGTSYTESTINSAQFIAETIFANQDLYATMGDMIASDQINNNINTSSDVYSGWISDINNQGFLHLAKDSANPFGESFNTGQSLLGYVYINGPLYNNTGFTIDDFQLTENTQGLIDSAYDTFNRTWSTSPDWIPICEQTSMVLRGLTATRLLSSTNQSTSISLDIEPSSYSYPGSTNIRFRIAVTTNLADNSSWITNAPVYNVTGAVTRVTVTNSSPSAFLKVIKQ